MGPFIYFFAKKDLSQNEIHILIEVVKALLTLLVFLIIWKKRKKKKAAEEKAQKQIDELYKKN
jgi:Na+-driven multidrug efflux pump